MELPSDVERQDSNGVVGVSRPSSGASVHPPEHGRRWAGLSSGSEHLGLAIALIVLVAFLSIKAPHFLTTRNLLNVLQQVSFLAIIAWGMTLVIIAAEIDVSVGSAVAFYGALLGVFVNRHDWPLLLSIVIVLVLAAAVGAAAGVIRAPVVPASQLRDHRRCGPAPLTDGSVRRGSKRVSHYS